MAFQRVADRIHIGFRLGIFGFHGSKLIRAAFEESQKALFLFLYIKAFQLRYHIGKHASDFA